jgi:GT2 family glycosyltransferase
MLPMIAAVPTAAESGHGRADDTSDSPGPIELTVVIPTRDRRDVLGETLARLARQSGGVSFEAIVVDDGSADGTPALVRQRAAQVPFALSLIENPTLGPAAARNRAIAAARAAVCLFINDDTLPRSDLLARHRDFHRRRPEAEAALLGRIDLAPDPPPTPFMRWLALLHFDYEGIEDPGNAGGGRLFTGNASVKTALLRRVGGFDESFKLAAYEDTDLGVRLEGHGMRLAYDARAVVDHRHPMDLPMAIDRMRGIGRSQAVFARRHADPRVPRRPGTRHRIKAGLLTGLAPISARSPRLQREIWRFLCHEAAREGYWGTIDETESGRPASNGALRIGETLARLASRDADARLPDAVAGS